MIGSSLHHTVVIINQDFISALEIKITGNDIATGPYLENYQSKCECGQGRMLQSGLMKITHPTVDRHVTIIFAILNNQFLEWTFDLFSIVTYLTHMKGCKDGGFLKVINH